MLETHPVPPRGSADRAPAPKAASKSLELVTLSGEDHWLSRPATRIQVLRRLERFLAAPR